MAATMSPSISHAFRKSFTMTSMFLLPARGAAGRLSGLVHPECPARCSTPIPKKAPPPVLKPGPPVDVPVVVVAGADVGVRRRQVAVEQRGRKARRSVVDVDVRAPAVERDRDLDRRRAALLPVVLRIALVIHGVVGRRA